MRACMCHTCHTVDGAGLGAEQMSVSFQAVAPKSETVFGTKTFGTGLTAAEAGGSGPAGGTTAVCDKPFMPGAPTARSHA